MKTARSNKDKEMAARMKAEGVVRHIARCPICSGLIAVATAYAHIAYHK